MFVRACARARAPRPPWLPPRLAEFIFQSFSKYEKKRRRRRRLGSGDEKKKKKEGEQDREKNDERRRAGGGDTAPLLIVLRQLVAHLRHLPLRRLHLPLSTCAQRARRRVAGPRGAGRTPLDPAPAARSCRAGSRRHPSPTWRP